MLIEEVSVALSHVILNSAHFLFIFSVFRMRHLKQVHYQIVVSGLIMGIINYLLKHVMISPVFSLYAFVFVVALLTVLFRFSFLFSFIIGITSIIIVAFLEAAVLSAPVYMGWITSGEIQTSVPLQVSFNLAIALILTLISILFKSKNWGFSFVMRRYTGREFLKPHNFIWCLILVIGSGLIILFAYDFFGNHPINMMIMITISTVFIIAIVYAYFQNKKSLRDRYGNTRKK